MCLKRRAALILLGCFLFSFKNMNVAFSAGIGNFPAEHFSLPHNNGILGLPAGPGSAADQYQRYERRKMQLDALPPPSSDVTIKKSPDALAAHKKGACVWIDVIQVDGAHKLSRDLIEAVTEKYRHHCVTIGDINQMMNGLNETYMREGYITSRAYIPEQHLSQKILRFVMVEGRISKISFKEDTESGKGSFASEHRRYTIAMAFPGLEGRVLDLHDLEQGIEQMNRLSDWNARMAIEPSSEAGSSNIVIKQPVRSVFHGQAWVDNFGQSSTGRAVGHSLLLGENVLGLLDLWSVEYDHSLIGPNHGARGSSYLSFNGSIPYGYWTFFGSYWNSRDTYSEISAEDIYHLGGARQDWSIGLSRVLLRHSGGVLSFQTSFEQKQFSSEIEHVVLKTQTGRQSFVNTRLSESLKGLGGVWYLTSGAKIAIDGAGTWNNYGKFPSSDMPHRSYVKPFLDIDGYVRFKETILWHMSLHGEYSTHNQASTNQLQLGGVYTVRGFLNQALVGNNGGYIRNDVSWSLPFEQMRCGHLGFLCHKILSQTQLYGAVDGGLVRAGYHHPYNLPPSLNGGEVVGGGIGVRRVGGSIFWNASLMHSFYRSHLPSEGYLVFLSMGFKL